MALSQHQFEGGGPPVLVRNTFLDIDDRPPTLDLQRARTAPPPRCNSLIDETSSSEEDDDDEEEAEEDARQPRNAGKGAAQAGDASPNSPQDRTVTRDCYESREDWKWVQTLGPASASNAKGGAAAPSGPPGASQGPGSEGQPVAMYPQAVQMVPVMMSQLDAGPAASTPQGRGANAAAPVAQPPTPAGASGGGAGSIEVSAGAAPPPPMPAAPGGAPGPGVDIDLMAPLAAPQPQTLTRAFSINSGHFRVHWTVDARKLRGNDKQAVSPPFELSFGKQFPSVTFKMMIYPKVTGDSKGGASFKKARGRGFVQLKCEAELSEAIANVSFRVSIGQGETKQEPRGPKSHNFSASAVCGLDREEEEWDFQSVVDQESMTFVVCLEIVPVVPRPSV